MTNPPHNWPNRVDNFRFSSEGTCVNLSTLIRCPLTLLAPGAGIFPTNFAGIIVILYITQLSWPLTLVSYFGSESTYMHTG